ncbi:helix-turn-helix domain-containing protein [Pelagibacterium halotolerans]|uniref:helix-turn-helix domain-containing protein n=1 Tax=Pelagibacterium halotolerans TaxID=531813 RepID=UPI00384AE107
MNERYDVPSYFVYGEPAQTLDVGFLHVETVMERKSAHFGHVSPHKHPLMGQITYWFQGAGVYMIEEQSWTFSAPAISFVPSDIIHGFDVELQSDAVVVSVSDDVLKVIAPQTDLALDAPVFLTGEPQSPVWNRIDLLIGLIREDYREHGGAGEKVLTGLVSTVLSLMRQLGGSVALPAASPEVKLALDLRRVVDRHFREDWTVARYVAELATTPHLLDKAARAVLGMSVKDLVMERRLLEAKRLLLFTIRSVEDIGRDCGFDDPAYFSRFFRRLTGEAPKAWRERHGRRAIS